MRFPRPLASCVVAVLGAGLLFTGAAAARPPEKLKLFEVSATGGYRFKGSANIDEPEQNQVGTARYSDGAAFGASVGYRTEPNGFIYVWYSQQNSELELTLEDADSVTTRRDLTIHYMHFGGYLEGVYGPTLPYLGLSVGATLFAPSDVGVEVRPSGAIEGGMKIPVTSFLHLRLLGRLPVTLMTGKTEIFCIDPEGCKVSLDGKPIVQFELMGGLGVNF